MHTCNCYAQRTPCPDSSQAVFFYHLSNESPSSYGYPYFVFFPIIYGCMYIFVYVQPFKILWWHDLLYLHEFRQPLVFLIFSVSEPFLRQ